MPPRKKPKFDFSEPGTSGITAAEGFIQEAYNIELYWPACQPLYSRIRRSDPEVTIVRNGMTALVRRMTAHWELPDHPNDDEKRAQDFAEEVMDDAEGGAPQLMEQWISQVLMYGWGWWSVVPGLRDKNWRAPGDDDWVSQYDDSYIGIRRFAWRDSSSFLRWQLSKTGRVKGMWQSQLNNIDSQNSPSDVEKLLKLENSLHMVYGDPHNPEGLSPLEAVYRLERLKQGFEMVLGIGAEHAAGFVEFSTEKSTLSNNDKTMIKDAAKSIMTAQEGNYVALPKGFRADLKDVRFQAAGDLLEVIRYYGILKMVVFNMQWMAMASLSGSGSYAALGDSSSLAILGINAIMEGFADQFDRQIGRRIFQWNADRFPQMQHRPRFRVSPVEKTISLLELGQFVQSIEGSIQLGPDDLKAIRKTTHFLPDTLPNEGEGMNGEPTPSTENETVNKPEGGAVEPTPQPEKVEQAFYKMAERAKVHDPELYAILVDGHK